MEQLHCGANIYSARQKLSALLLFGSRILFLIPRSRAQLHRVPSPMLACCVTQTMPGSIDPGLACLAVGLLDPKISFFPLHLSLPCPQLEHSASAIECPASIPGAAASPADFPFIST